jgi:hypothetical protein
VPVFFLPEQRRKTCRRIEPWKAKPIDTAVATHQRASLGIAEERVVLDLCIFPRHFLFLFLLLLILLMLMLLRVIVRCSCALALLFGVRQSRDLLSH